MTKVSFKNTNRVINNVSDFHLFQMLTYGVAFQLLGEAALDYLNQREIQLGGYKSHITLFQPKDSSTAPFPVLLYVATPSNQHWLGPERLDKVAEQVCIKDLTSDLEIPNNYTSVALLQVTC